MSVRRRITEFDGIYFITFTCWRWLNLFEIANAYSAVYKWFDFLKSRGHYILGYVIMPNHVHGLIAFRNTQGILINSIVGNGKRFMAYEIIKGLTRSNNQPLLNQLEKAVNGKQKLTGKLHQVFQPSFDWKNCDTEKFVEQKLEYIHKNPCSGKWNLARNPWDYVHSSAQYYYQGKQGIYEVLSYPALEDLDLTKTINEPEGTDYRQSPRNGRRCGEAEVILPVSAESPASGTPRFQRPIFNQTYS